MIENRRSEHGQGGFYFIVGLLGLVLFIVLAGACSAWNPVGFGTVEAVREFGSLTGDVLTEGSNWIKPFVQGTEAFSVLTHTYETSENPDTSKADYTDFPVTAQTSNGQQIGVTYTVKFRVDPSRVVEVLRTWGSMDAVVENVIKADSRSEARKRAQDYEAEALFSGNGILLYEAEVEEILTESFDRAGVAMVDFLVRKITFDPDYIQAIENQQIAQENIKTAQFNAEAAEFKREEAIRLSEGDKQRDILLAEAAARKTVLNAEAEAESIRLQGAALREFPEVIQWQFVQDLDGIAWGLIPSDGLTPLLPLPSPAVP